MYDLADTIAAIVTASGEGGISIIRISGPKTFAIADLIFACAGAPPSQRHSHNIIYGKIHAGNKIIDEVILLMMRAPHSYTREDVVEIQGHGGLLPARRILQTVLQKGARMAEPGEFTLRAFLNGRIDLVQAEAVMDLVRAKTDRGAAAAIEQLSGKLSLSVNQVYDDIVKICADLEASLDFSEDDSVPSNLIELIGKQLQVIKKDLQQILATWCEGHLLRDGALAVISGKPNVGKSTLLNSLLGQERAIVAPIPGTTRDIIEETIVIEGFPIRLVDTAGLRETSCAIEQEGVRRAKHHIQKADLHLYVIDASQPVDDNEQNYLNTLDNSRLIIILNKTDLGNYYHYPPNSNFIDAQLIYGKGLSEINAMIIKKLGILKSIPHSVISDRHKANLTKAYDLLEKVIVLLQDHNTNDIVPIISQLRKAIEMIGEITGKIYYNELLQSIFSRFCIGK